MGLTVTCVDEGNLTTCKVNQLGPLQTVVGNNLATLEAHGQLQNHEWMQTFLLAPLEQHRTGIVQKSRNRTRQHWYVHEISWLFNVIVQVLNIHWNGAMEMIVTVVNGCEKQRM